MPSIEHSPPREREGSSHVVDVHRSSVRAVQYELLNETDDRQGRDLSDPQLSENVIQTLKRDDTNNDTKTITLTKDNSMGTEAILTTAAEDDTDYNAEKMIALSSLLQQFVSVKVRGDLLSGQFGPSVNPDILHMIDEIRCILMPRWQAGGIAANMPRSSQALNHFKKLVSNSSELFWIPNTPSKVMTYEEWMSLLDLIGKNGYWSRVAPADRCTHLVQDQYEQPPIKSDSVKSGKFPLQIGVKKMSKTSSRKRVEEIVLSSDSSDTSSTEPGSSTDTSSSERGSSSSHSGSRRKHRRHKRRISDSRKVVTPPLFKMDGKTSLEDYLRTFEEYFQKKFKGNSYDQTQMLSSFLTGELLKVYEIRGGRKLKYRKMKDELVKYYKDKKIGSRSYWKKQLESAALQVDETFDLYGMRLVELANLAYPKDKKDCATQVRKQFLKALPPYIVTKITDAERASNAPTGSRKHLAFKAIVNIARDLQNTGVRPKTIMWASGAFEASDEAPKSNANSQSQRNSSQYKSNRDRSFGRTECSYCRKPGHSKPDCWRAAHLCLICGGNHFIEKCPKYDVNHRSRSQTRKFQNHMEPALNC